MDNGGVIAILIVIGIVVIINGALILWARGSRTHEHFRLWQRAAKRARNPWQSEDNNLKELSQLVKDLNNNRDENGEKLSEK